MPGNSQLNDRMRGEKAPDVLANEIISQLSDTLQAQIGALYVRENGHLRRTGQYAYDSSDENEIVALGHGLVGQAAVDGKHILFPDVPEHYIKVRSALGNLAPRNLIIYPFKYEGEVKGVVEIGSVKPFSDLDVEFLNMVHNHIGIAINASQSRQKLKELLEETQRQSEELETQQEELKQFNEELLEKTHLLEKSEEELKTQQEELQLSTSVVTRRSIAFTLDWAIARMVRSEFCSVSTCVLITDELTFHQSAGDKWLMLAGSRRNESSRMWTCRNVGFALASL